MHRTFTLKAGLHGLRLGQDPNNLLRLRIAGEPTLLMESLHSSQIPSPVEGGRVEQSRSHPVFQDRHVRLLLRIPSFLPIPVRRSFLQFCSYIEGMGVLCFLLSPPGLGRFSSLFPAFFVSEFFRRGFPPLAAQRYRSGVLPFCHSASIRAASRTDANSSRVLLDQPKSARKHNETLLLTYAQR